MRKEKVDWDDVHRRNYENRAFWDIYWLNKARDLLESAKLFEPHVTKLWESYRPIPGIGLLESYRTITRAHTSCCWHTQWKICLRRQ